jgi:hypothetical protein
METFALCLEEESREALLKLSLPPLQETQGRGDLL